MITVEWWGSVIAPFILVVLSSLCGIFLTCGKDLCKDAMTCLCAKLDSKDKLKQNLDLLRDALDDLTTERDVVSSKAGDEEVNGREKLPKVVTWLSEVEAIETNTKLLLDEACGQDATSVTSGCSRSTDNNISDLSMERVSKRLDEVRNLFSRGKKFEVVTMKPPLPVVEERNVKAFGLDATLTRTWEKLKKDKILGIHGVGGVGKSTLLSLINNNVSKVMGNNIDVVIWVDVSRGVEIEKIFNQETKKVEIEKIQDTICKRLRICDENWSTYSKQNKAAILSSVLTIKKPRFVLLLDGLWKEVSLSEIGIPLQGSEYRVVFTTRSLAVCGKMEAVENIKVECLSETDAWELFKVKARSSTLNEESLGVAEKIAAKCGGLPLALVVIGKAMSSNTNKDKWKRALDTLDSSPSEITDIEEDMFTVLKLSYDYLKDPVAKLGFQYCALFPKAHNIIRDELVEYWIGEGIIKVTKGREWAMSRGNSTIDTLVEAGLLMEDDELYNQKAYMHDMIQEMAVWMVSKSDSEERYVVKTRAELSQLPDVSEWKTVKKMSLMNNKIQGIPDNPEFCGQAGLITLFLQSNKLVDIVGGFFTLLSTLVVLDLSHNLDITKLPEEISKLVALRYLSLLGTMIKVLPDGLEELTQLIHLDLESTSNLRSIKGISSLLKLHVFKFASSFASLDESLLRDLEGLKGLQLLTITVVKEVDVLEAFLKSEVAGKTQGLYLEEVAVSGASLAAIGALDRLSKLEMVRCDITESGIEWEGISRDQHFPSNQIPPRNPSLILKESEIVECEGSSSRDQPSNEITPSNPWFKNLKSLVLLSCIQVEDLTWSKYATNLESLQVESSPKIKEIIINQETAEGVVDGNAKPLQKLQSIRLRPMGELSSFNWRRQTFPKLKLNDVDDIENCGPSTSSDD